MPPKQALAIRFFRELKDRLIAVSKDEKLQQDGTLTGEGEWPFLE